MCGVAIIAPEVQPSVTRIAMVRLPEISPRLRDAAAYLPPQASIAADLSGLGLHVADAVTVDRCLADFLTGSGNGLDQMSATASRALVGVFDRSWSALSAHHHCSPPGMTGASPLE